MVLKSKMQTLTGFSFLCALFNAALLHRRVFFLMPLSLGLHWLFFLFNCGLIYSWEQAKSFKNVPSLKLYVRYKIKQPGGFFYNYPLSSRRKPSFSLITLRFFLAARPGIILFLSTPAGLLTGQACLRRGLGGVLRGLVV